jgi:NAD(P)-dependent dehydrogenase (short-subunit alcohol dehydrogenase family)
MSCLKDAVVVVTGGGTGVGRALAREAAARGARVLIGSTGNAEETVNLISAAGGQAAWVTTDVADYDSVTNLKSEALRRFGQVNVVVNNAASGGENAGLDTADPAKAKRLFEVNVLGMFNGIRVFADELKRSASSGQPAYILNVGSEHSLGVPPHVMALSTYTVSKYANLGFTDVARRDFAGSGVGVSLLAPGWVLTERVSEMITANPALRSAIEPFAQSSEDVAVQAFDGLLTGTNIIATNPASRAFALEHARDVMADVQRLPLLDIPDPDVTHPHDGTGDATKCPVPHASFLGKH